VINTIFQYIQELTPGSNGSASSPLTYTFGFKYPSWCVILEHVLITMSSSIRNETTCVKQITYTEAIS